VGDVLAVTRSLAPEGMAMMAVTREMFIAREVAGRVAVTDGGGVRHAQDRPRSGNLCKKGSRRRRKAESKPVTFRPEETPPSSRLGTASLSRP